MTLSEIISAFPAWVNAHGIVAKPENDEVWTPTPDGAPALVQMTYIAPSGSRLRLPADVMALESDKDSTIELYLHQVQALYGKAQRTEIAFSAFTHPQPEQPSTRSGAIGDLVPRDIVMLQASVGGRIDPSKVYRYANGTSPADGQRVSEEGHWYLAVKPSPFSCWWQLIA